jgi:Tfp pilus assembly protein PilN
MNFLKQGRRGFTYREMIYGIGGWCVFLAVLYGVQTARLYMLERKFDMTKQRLVSLDAEKERQIELIKLVSKKRAGISARHDLASILANRPRWLGMLRAITRSLPSDVWLDFLDVRLDKDWYRVEIKGKAKSQRELTEFVLQLEETGYFNKTTLENTQLSEVQAGTFDFEIFTEPVAQKLLRDE